MLVSAAMTAFVVMTICEQHCATQVYKQPEASNPDCLIEMNLKRRKKPVSRLACH